jgi:hypothetical protein
MPVWPARCASQPKNVHARKAPAGGSIRPGLSVAEQAGSSRDARPVLGGRGEPIPILIQEPPLQRNLSKVSPRNRPVCFDRDIVEEISCLRQQLLDFRAAGGKWQVVHGWFFANWRSQLSSQQCYN